MIHRRSIIFVPALWALVALPYAASAGANSAPVGPLSSAADSREYVDARYQLTAPEHVERWYALTLDLKADFDAICGDTFCEGDYSNFESLAFRCSVELTAGTIGQCVWVFAASDETIAPSSGEVSVHTEAFRCPMPVPRDTPVLSLLGRALHRP